MSGGIFGRFRRARAADKLLLVCLPFRGCKDAAISLPPAVRVVWVRQQIGQICQGKSTRTSLDERTNRLSPLRASEICARIALWAMLLMVAACPFTERFCAFDDFPRCGQDSELTLIFLISLMAMVLLLALRRRANLNDAFAMVREFLAVPLKLLFHRSICVYTERAAWASVKKRPDRLIALPVPLRI